MHWLIYSIAIYIKSYMNSPLTIAKRLLEVIPPIVQKIRSEARLAVKGKITLPQFRILSNISQGIKTVGGIAEVHGVAQPTMSKMVDGLVKRGMIKRIADKDDRRQINLALSKKGADLYRQSLKSIQLQLSKALSELNLTERNSLAKTLDQLSLILPRKRG
ncbi:MAG: MarR family protein [Bacteriovoracaceae bacterium]|nr:MarR family protein [Bacteriovoracaceae bacterium]